MLKIRLQRIGRRNDPHYRILVAEHTAGPKSNNFVEKVGTVNPKTKEIQLKTDRITYWISVGAQPSGRVHNILVKEGIIKGKTINVLPHKSPVVDEEKIAAEKKAAEEKAEAEKKAKEEAAAAEKAEAEDSKEESSEKEEEKTEEKEA